MGRLQQCSLLAFGYRASNLRLLPHPVGNFAGIVRLLLKPPEGSNEI